MEKRSNERKSIGMDVIVSCPGIGMWRGRTDDVGLGGLFINARMVNVPTGSVVSVTFQPDPNYPDLSVDTRGEVIHQGHRGFGLRFSCLDDASTKALQGLMNEADRGALSVYPLGVQAV